MISFRSGSSRLPIAPLATLFALAVLAMAWLASTHVCVRPIVLTMCGHRADAMRMGSMSMPMPMSAAAPMSMPMVQTPFGGVMICPVVLGLIVLSTLLAAWAIVAGWRDRHRLLTISVLVRALARLSVLRTFVALAASGGCAIGTIVAVDGGVAVSPSLCATLAIILAGISILATLCSIALARCVIALCARLIVALARAIDERNAGARRAILVAIRPLPLASFPIAFGRGLRAPPTPMPVML
jgi:hypothetical protein